jgi:hypothetical protein
MKKIKKYTTGGVSDKPKKTVVKSESKNYKTITKGNDTKVKRTVKGVVTKATPVKQTEANRAAFREQAERDANKAKQANRQQAKRMAERYLYYYGGDKPSKYGGGKPTANDLKVAKNMYNEIANQEVPIPKIPKTKEYGDYKKGGSVKRKKKK